MNVVQSIMTLNIRRYSHKIGHPNHLEALGLFNGKIVNLRTSVTNSLNTTNNFENTYITAEQNQQLK